MPNIVHLNENLKRQAALYSELKNFAQLKQQALVKNDLHEIEAITVREEQLIMEAASLEKDRLQWAERIAEDLGKTSENITLSELAERFPELTGVKTELENVLTNLREVNEMNTQLIKQAMKVVDLTLGLLTAQPTGSTYGRPGGKENEPKSTVRFLDRSI